MNVKLTDADVAGESSYNELLAPLAGPPGVPRIAKMDDGALVVFVEGFDAPAIIRNSAGGYGDHVTDVAAIRYRVDELGARRIIYVTDARQHHHFELAFAVARMAGYLPDDVVAEHVGFRHGARPGRDADQDQGGRHRHPRLAAGRRRGARCPLALAAIKYADLSNSLQKDYVFDAERMTQTTGDTGPYLQYAHSRCAGILREAAARARPRRHHRTGRTGRAAVGVVADPLRRDRPGGNRDDLTPHKLCTYLFELATLFSTFYEQCPVLKSAGQVRASRLALVAATKQVLASGLGRSASWRRSGCRRQRAGCSASKRGELRLNGVPPRPSTHS